MVIHYKPAARARRPRKNSHADVHSPTTPVGAVEHRFDTSRPSDSDDDDDDAEDETDTSSTTSDENPDLSPSHLTTKSLIALTCGIGGIQLIWSTIFSHGTAYLFALGVTKSQSSLIWAVAPTCGALVQPFVGALSDNCRSRWGRRRPFIFGGMLGLVVALAALAWVGDLVKVLARVMGATGRSEEGGAGVQIATQLATIACIVVLNLAMQPVQSGLRTLMVDVCPSEQQSVASAWAGRFTGVGNVLGYFLGSLPLDFITEDREIWRFRFLSLLSVVAMSITLMVTICLIREEDSRGVERGPQRGMLLLRILRDVRLGWSAMSTRSRRVLYVQFFSWMGWFGFLFYSTSFVNKLYTAEWERRSSWRPNDLGDAGIRLGTFASLLSAIVALTTTVFIPYISTTDHAVPRLDKSSLGSLVGQARQAHIIWTLSHVLYVLCILSTVFITSATTAVFIIAVTGVSWGITQWAPFALLGEDIAMRQAERDSVTEGGIHQWTSSPSGAMMGVHNAAISVPQIIAALGSSFIFWISDRVSAGTDDGIAWVLRASGVAALVAAFLAWRVRPDQ